MQAIGMIETKGLIPAIDSADVMLKTSQVELVEKALVGGGLVTITVTGDVGAVKAAVDAGASAVSAFGQDCLISRHVIARPHNEIGSVLFTDKKVPETQNPVDEEKEALTLPEDDIEPTIIESAILSEPTLSEEAVIVSDDYSDEQLTKLSVGELRKLAEKNNNVKLSVKAIQKANRATLIKRLKEAGKHQVDKKE
ncbi:BMC domain-containing protein [Enterococcus larvae]|uniref:BMC domain-containing protein n=1 Tax=Enterococcus larvae TaxID=2794352 RepID=UPI003F2C3D76